MRVRDPLLGTRCEVEVRAASVEAIDTAELAVLAEVERLEMIFTLFDEASELHALRRLGETASVELNEVWQIALLWHQRTGGVFHHALQPLVDVWAEAAESDRVPSTNALAEAVTILDPSGHTHLDFNALAKGWIADRGLAAAFASDQAPSSGWLSLGGDLVHRGEGSVAVGIQDPARPYDNVAPLATIDITSEALATSGTGHRYWTIDGERYSRVLDPRTGIPVDHVRSATVVAPTAATADVLATVALVLDPAETISLVASHNAHCLLVTATGEVVQTTDRFRPA